MQQQLIESLCVLAAGSVVDQAWLQSVWAAVPATWVERFWTLPKANRTAAAPGIRSVWIATIAAASVADKQTINDLMAEQLRFAELYHNPPALRLTKHAWATGAFQAVNKLLKSFYAPLFYKDEGYANPDGTLFHKDHFIDPKPNICPYTDNIIQDPKLDHFLPKDQFPMLSCHPDNLIPCSTDANSGSHKGTEAPLDIEEPDQAGAWFHPRWRSAVDTYRLTFPAGTAPQPRITFEALSATNQAKLNNLARMFGLEEFWGGFLDDEVQNVASDVSGNLYWDRKPSTEANVRDGVLKRADQERRRIGKDALAIVKSSFYEHIAHTPILLEQVVRTCQQGT